MKISFRFRFGPLHVDQIMPRLEHVAQSENVNLTETGKEALIRLAKGDMRKVINILQSCSMAFDEVSEDTVYTCVGHPLRSDIVNIVTWSLNESFSYAYANIDKLRTMKGLSLQERIIIISNTLFQTSE